MPLSNVFDVAGSAMNAQSVRLNVTASNLANAGSVHGDPTKVYRSRQPVFSTFNDALRNENAIGGVRLDGIVENQAPLGMQFRPDHPDANADGKNAQPRPSGAASGSRAGAGSATRGAKGFLT